MSLLPTSGIEQLIETSIDSKITNIHTCLPGKILKTDGSVCSVQIILKRKVRKSDGKIVDESRPIIEDCPLMFLNVKNFAISLPVQPGDECLVFFSERDIDNWYDTGQEKSIRTLRKFNLSDGFVLPAVASKPKKLENYSSSDLEIRMKNNQSKIIIKENGDIELTNQTKITLKSPEIILDGETKVTKGLTVEEVIECKQDIKALGDVVASAVSLKNHLHSGVQTGASNTGPPV